MQSIPYGERVIIIILFPISNKKAANNVAAFFDI